MAVEQNEEGKRVSETLPQDAHTRFYIPLPFGLKVLNHSTFYEYAKRLQPGDFEQIKRVAEGEIIRYFAQQALAVIEGTREGVEGFEYLDSSKNWIGVLGMKGGILDGVPESLAKKSTVLESRDPNWKPNVFTAVDAYLVDAGRGLMARVLSADAWRDINGLLIEHTATQSRRALGKEWQPIAHTWNMSFVGYEGHGNSARVFNPAAGTWNTLTVAGGGSDAIRFAVRQKR
ncbi:MAG: hypothetical protein KGL95_00070 [Patescibacteria group bacterium]|nr:hypothetical protein [Patescibacteria group bacterium]